jgi:xylulose-5-phosphate/fructose-6-phosphate phosphoketolase
MADTVAYHHDFIRENGYDIAEVEEWEWKPLR